MASTAINTEADDLEVEIVGEESGSQGDKRKYGDRGSTASEPDTPCPKRRLLNQRT